MTAREQQPLRVDVDDEDGRYHRQALISWWDQDRLAAAKVLVVGAGALGNELIKNLALLGVGNVLVIDMDQIENSNLSRCVLFRESDEGRNKAEVAAEAARSLNPDIQIGSVIGDVRTDLGLRVFASADVVLGGLDNREARLHINESCWKTNTPWIDGAIEGLMGVMRVFEPPGSACYECTMNDRDHELLAARRACSLLTRDQMLQGKVPTTATSASVIAGMQAQEAVKLLHRDRVKASFAGQGFAYNGLTHESYIVNYRRREDCLSHDTYDLDGATPVSSGVTFRQILAELGSAMADPVLEIEREIVLSLDCAACGSTDQVRQPVERLTVGAAICPNCGADRLPNLAHSVSLADVELLDLTPLDLGLPLYDVITARSGTTRRHFLLDGEGDPFDALVSS
jgi:molybdopterin/thiamine biosynthesis adenylyltransferase